jgi:hypothetical protein
VKLYACTRAGNDLGIDILLTGLVNKVGDTIVSVEIYMPIGSHLIVKQRIQPLTKGRGSREVLWVGSNDLCANDGAPLSQEALRAEIARVEESLRYEALHGPLGENWP